MTRSDRRGPRTIVELLGGMLAKNVLGHWDRVLQLAFLMLVPLLALLALGGAVAVAVTQLRLDPTRWAAVGGCAALFLTGARAGYRITTGRRKAAKKPGAKRAAQTSVKP